MSALGRTDWREEIERETKDLQAFLTWIAHHRSELSPLSDILMDYAAMRVMHSWLGPTGAERCARCLGYLGIHLHTPQAGEICSCAASVACREALMNPVTALRLAQRSIDLISEAAQNLAKLPANLEEKHRSLAKAILGHRGSPAELLAQAMSIYGGKPLGGWLHLGLPQIMDGLSHYTHLTEDAAMACIQRVYGEWRAWGQAHGPRVAAAAGTVKSELPSNQAI